MAQPKKPDAETPPTPKGPAGTPLPTPDEVLARLEQTRRAADLLERRITAWETSLDDVRRGIHRIEHTPVDGAPDWQTRVDEMSHRLARLERSRDDETPPPPTLRAAATARPAGALAPAPIDVLVAIVRARWSPPDARPGDPVALTATCDGLADGTIVSTVIRTSGEDRTIVELEAKSDGDRVRANWTVPTPAPAPELYFEMTYKSWTTRSPVLDLARD